MQGTPLLLALPILILLCIICHDKYNLPSQPASSEGLLAQHSHSWSGQPSVFLSSGAIHSYAVAWGQLGALR